MANSGEGVGNESTAQIKACLQMSAERSVLAIVGLTEVGTDYTKRAATS